MKIDDSLKIKRYYKNKKIVNKYIEYRFKTPIGRIEHLKEVEFTNSIISNYGCVRLLEIAPGPARITSELIVDKGIAVDSSKEMINLAKKIMNKANKKWKFELGDAFNLKYKENYFDLVFGFRFFFHFKKVERIKLYEQIRKVLKKKGLFIFNALNYDKTAFIRKIVGSKKYKVYDKLYKKKELIKEMEINGFKVLKLKKIINHYWIEIFISKSTNILKLNRLGENLIRYLEKRESKNPLTWAVLCQKK